jgi:hypothetical protein
MTAQSINIYKKDRRMLNIIYLSLCWALTLTTSTLITVSLKINLLEFNLIQTIGPLAAKELVFTKK